MTDDFAHDVHSTTRIYFRTNYPLRLQLKSHCQGQYYYYTANQCELHIHLSTKEYTYRYTAFQGLVRTSGRQCQLFHQRELLCQILELSEFPMIYWIYRCPVDSEFTVDLSDIIIEISITESWSAIQSECVYILIVHCTVTFNIVLYLGYLYNFLDYVQLTRIIGVRST